MKVQIKIFLFSFLFLRINLVSAQIDPHFSQYYAYPLWLNPALTGVFDGSFRGTTNFRDQWQSINNAYKTGAFSTDFKTESKFGFGINILDQAAGEVGFNYFSAYGSLSYEINLSSSTYKKLNFGLQMGVLNRSFDINKLQFDSQYNPLKGFDPGLPSGELSLSNSSQALDINSGLFYYENNPLAKINKFIGIGIFHLNRGINPYPVEGIKSIMPIRVNLHMGLNLHYTEFLTLTPHLIYVSQQSNQILALGINSDFSMGMNKGFILGGMVRIQDAYSINAGIYVNNFTFGFSYDFTNSSLIAANLGQGGPEISMTYILRGNQTDSRRVCPRF